jgi:hypothetical protein
LHSTFLVEGGGKVEAEATGAEIPRLFRVDELVASDGSDIWAGSWKAFR